MKKMKNNIFSLKWRCKENSFFFAEISVLPYYEFKKPIRIIINHKSLVHAVAILNSNICIFQSNY